MALIRLILIILVVYYGFHLIIKPILRMLLQTAVRKVVEKEFDQFRTTQQPKRSEGSIHVDYIPENNQKKSKNKPTDEGEYVDFEEVK